MKLFALLQGNYLIKIRRDGYSPMPLIEGEMENCQELQDNGIEMIDILDDLHLDLAEYDISNLDVQQSVLHCWHQKFLNNNINGFLLPIWINNNEDYYPTLEKMFNNYEDAINTPAFKHEKNLLNEVQHICNVLLKCAFNKNANNVEALNLMSSLLLEYRDNKFWVSELGKSYPMRGIAPFSVLHHAGYNEIYSLMMDTPLDLYRVRKEEKCNIKTKNDMLHLPYSKRGLASEQRFSLKGCPCLYLGTTTYDCWKECREPKLDLMYISGFRPNQYGEKLKILNLAISCELINGIYHKQLDNHDSVEHCLQNEMLKIFPIVIATSFSVLDESPNRGKIEYMVSNLLMKSLKTCDIDGVAYLSKRVDNSIQYPCAVNLAFPAHDISREKEYSDICKGFLVTTPRRYTDLIRDNETTKNYISTVYHKNYMNISVDYYERTQKNFLKCDNNVTKYYD